MNTKTENSVSMKTRKKKNIQVSMSPRRLKRFKSFLAAEKVVKSIKKGMKELHSSQECKEELKSAIDLANELD